MKIPKHPIEKLFRLLKQTVKLERPITIEEMNPASLADEEPR